MKRTSRLRRRHRACGKPSAAQQAHQDAQRAHGCAVCRYRIAAGIQDRRFGQCGPTHVHHGNLDDLHGQKQTGQDDTVALGAYHHEGDVLPNWTGSRMRDVFGPSFKLHARDFRAWTADVLPGYGRGTLAWMRWQNEQLAA